MMRTLGVLTSRKKDGKKKMEKVFCGRKGGKERFVRREGEKRRVEPNATGVRGGKEKMQGTPHHPHLSSKQEKEEEGGGGGEEH